MWGVNSKSIVERHKWYDLQTVFLLENKSISHSFYTCVYLYQWWKKSLFHKIHLQQLFNVGIRTAMHHYIHNVMQVFWTTLELFFLLYLSITPSPKPVYFKYSYANEQIITYYVCIHLSSDHLFLCMSQQTLNHRSCLTIFLFLAVVCECVFASPFFFSLTRLLFVWFYFLFAIISIMRRRCVCVHCFSFAPSLTFYYYHYYYLHFMQPLFTDYNFFFGYFCEFTHSIALSFSFALCFAHSTTVRILFYGTTAKNWMESASVRGLSWCTIFVCSFISDLFSSLCYMKRFRCRHHCRHHCCYFCRLVDVMWMSFDSGAFVRYTCVCVCVCVFTCISPCRHHRFW